MKFLTVSLAALCCAYSVLALTTPRIDTPGVSNHLVSRDVSTPRVIIYTDEYVGGDTGLPTAGDLAGYNVLILAFLMVSGAQDQVAAWKSLSSSVRASTKKSYSDAGITLMLSSFGSTDAPTSDGHDAATVAKTHAAFVKQYDLEGIDVDYEDMNAINKADGKAEQWLITYTQTLRNQLPAGQYYITHAPVAPWFSPMYTAGAYTKVHKQVGDQIDWYNVQFYNQGDTEYTTCQGLLKKSSNAFPKSSVFEINSVAGVPLNKIVIGKPSAAFQASNGWVDFQTLATCITQAGKDGWSAGTMFWEYGKNLKSISALVRALAAISGGGGIPNLSKTTTALSTTTTLATPTQTSDVITTTTSGKHGHTSTLTDSTTTSSAAEPTATSPGGNDDPKGSGSCDSAKPWDANTDYTGGFAVSTPTYVTYGGSLWGNNWWTQGDKPEAGEGMPWKKVKSCPSSKRAANVEARAEELGNVTGAGAKRNLHKRIRRVYLSHIHDSS